jgi:hypothetical protein
LHQRKFAAHASEFQHGSVLATSSGVLASFGIVIALDAMWIAIATSSS